MRQKLKYMDKLLFFLMLLYSILGLVMVFSASSITAVLQYGYSESYFFVRQLIFFVAAYIVGFFVLFMSDKFVRLFRCMPKVFGFGAIILLILTMFFGVNVNGAVSWLRIGPISFQPSEFAKTGVILAIAFSFNNVRKMAKGFKYIIPFIYGVVCFALIAGQPDFGSAMILAIICFLIFMSLPLKDKNFSKIKIAGGALVIVGVCLFLFGGEILKNTNFFTDEQISRLTYTNPCTRYSENTGYQVCNGFIAINNGGLFGVGLGNSTQKYLYLPEAYTDFIFPIVVEELGSIVGVLIIIGYIIILYRLLRIAKSSETLSSSIIAYGTFSFILSHLLINLLGVLAIIPLTGVPLPFLSNGGSFNFNIILLLFICERVQVESNKRKVSNAIRNIR